MDEFFQHRTDSGGRAHAAISCSNMAGKEIFEFKEIMAYADGQLDESSIKRIQDAISSDPEAKDFYESMIFSDDVIKDTMQQLETSFKKNINSWSGQ